MQQELYIIGKFSPQDEPDVFFCDCCKARMRYGGFTLNTGAHIDNHCRTVLMKLQGVSVIEEADARELGVGQSQAEYFGVRFVSAPQNHVMTDKEREAADKQAMQDEYDLFG